MCFLPTFFPEKRPLILIVICLIIYNSYHVLYKNPYFKTSNFDPVLAANIVPEKLSSHFDSYMVDHL